MKFLQIVGALLLVVLIIPLVVFFIAGWWNMMETAMDTLQNVIN